jgi:hypothetical protein
MQEILLGSNKNSKNTTSYKTLKELNNFLAPQIESHLIDQASDLCNAAGKVLAKTGGRHGKLFKAAGSLVKITGTGGKIALQSASKVSKLPVAPTAGIIFNLSQIEELHSTTKYNDLITNGITLVQDIIKMAGSLCTQVTQSLFDILFTVEAEQDLTQWDASTIQNDSLTDHNEFAEIAGNHVEQFFDIYCP